MSSYAHVILVDGYLDAVADIVCGERLKQLVEIGVFQAGRPLPGDQTAAAAMRCEDLYLGLASWSLTPLYVDGRKRLREDRTNFRAASAMLLAAPEYTTAWNVRKLRMTVDKIGDELQFVRLVLLRSPKSAEAWAHRSWILSHFRLDESQLEGELDLASVAATRATHNYYAGVHRLRVVSNVSRTALMTELQRSRKWLRTHISDSSGWWYHRVLLAKLIPLEASFIRDETAYSSELFERYKQNYQSVRIHWKWMLTLQDVAKHIGREVT